MDPRNIQRYVELLFLAIAWFSVLACLIRTDYNFPFALFCYYLWISRDDKANSLMLIVLNAVLIVVDIIWLLSVGSIWTSEQTDNPVWSHLHVLHIFVVYVSILNLVLKVVVIYLINNYRNQQPQQGQIGGTSGLVVGQQSQFGQQGQLGGSIPNQSQQQKGFGYS